MSEAGADRVAYEAAKVRLVAMVRSALSGQQQARTALFTAKRNELRALAKELRCLADRVESGPAWLDLETQIETESDDTRAAGAAVLKATTGSMRELADMAERAAAENYKDPRALPILDWAALVFLHLRYRHRQELPTTYSGHPAVIEFAEVLTAAAGAERGTDRALTLLKQARESFDPYMPPHGFDALI